MRREDDTTTAPPSARLLFGIGRWLGRVRGVPATAPPPLIVGIGIDVAGIDRFGRALDRNPGLARRLFTEAELTLPSGAARGTASLAARFAAKEAVAKALGAPGGLRWHDAEIRTVAGGRPTLRVRGTVAAAAARCGIGSWHVSLTHDADVASAVVVASS
uniref:Holo-[acyl-carrier-protein] synthase n=1 Tax=Streptomyces sp. SANK 61196 TaxID=764784 RepID=E2EKM0_9ACTN|nr:phosphopantetheinyl transferase [Streptomyces sp. SANK 61196]